MYKSEEAEEGVEPEGRKSNSRPTTYDANSKVSTRDGPPAIDKGQQ